LCSAAFQLVRSRATSRRRPSYLNGFDDVTNSGSANATLTEGGGSGFPDFNTYSGLISDGATHKRAIIHTSGFVDIFGSNTYSGGTNLQGGIIEVDNDSALGSGDVNMASGTMLEAGYPGYALGNNIALASGSETILTFSSHAPLGIDGGRVLLRSPA
jgi:hypothetical protein